MCSIICLYSVETRAYVFIIESVDFVDAASGQTIRSLPFTEIRNLSVKISGNQYNNFFPLSHPHYVLLLQNFRLSRSVESHLVAAPVLKVRFFTKKELKKFQEDFQLNDSEFQRLLSENLVEKVETFTPNPNDSFSINIVIDKVARVLKCISNEPNCGIDFQEYSKKSSRISILKAVHDSKKRYYFHLEDHWYFAINNKGRVSLTTLEPTQLKTNSSGKILSASWKSCVRALSSNEALFLD